MSLDSVKLSEQQAVNFIVWVCPLLKPSLVMAETMLQTQGDRLNNICFLEKGTAAYVLPRYNDFAYMDVNTGDKVGVLDIIVFREEYTVAHVEELESDMSSEP
jgi:hypothetical protein